MSVEKQRTGIGSSALLLAACLVVAAAAFPGECVRPALGATLEGTVRNGTTGREGEPDRVVLLSLEGGMEEVASLDGVRGSFRIENGALDEGGDFLLQAVYLGVSYNETFHVHRGQPPEPITLTLYEVTQEPIGISVAIPHVIIRRVARDRLQIDKTYQIENRSDPPRTFFTGAGSFRLPVPVEHVAVQRFTFSSGQFPIRVSPLETEDGGIMAIDRPVRPGQSQVQITYLVEYPDETYRFREPILYPTDLIGIFLLPGDFSVAVVGVEDLGFREEVRARVLRALDPPLGSEVGFSLSGGSIVEAPPEETGGSGQDVRVLLVRNRTHRFAPWIMGGLALFLFGGAYVMTREKQRGRRDLLARKRVYLRDLIELEARFERNGMPETEFEREQASVRRKLRKVITNLEEIDRVER